MAIVKVKFKIGPLEFYAEGDQNWVSKHLDKIIDKSDAMNVVTQLGVSGDQPHKPMGADPEIAKKSLASFLKEKDAQTNQNKKFLATSVWLEAKGKSRLNPGDVTKALKDANQKRLGNASDTLAQNVNKGFCERDGSQYFVTQEGKASLG